MSTPTTPLPLPRTLPFPISKKMEISKQIKMWPPRETYPTPPCPFSSSKSGKLHCNENPIYVLYSFPPFLGITRPHSQLSRSCVCERFICSWIGPYISCSRIDRPIMGGYLNRSQTQKVETGTVAEQFLIWEYLFRIFVIGSLQCGLRSRL